MVSEFTSGIEKANIDADVKAVLSTLCSLFATHIICENAGEFLAVSLRKVKH